MRIELDKLREFYLWLDAAARSLDLELDDDEDASEGAIALTAAIARLDEMLTGGDPRNMKSTPLLKRCMEMAADYRALKKNAKP